MPIWQQIRTANQPYKFLEIRAYLLQSVHSPYSINYSRTYLEICAEIYSAVHSPYSSIYVQHLIRPYTSKSVQTWPYSLLEIRANKCSRTQH